MRRIMPSSDTVESHRPSGEYAIAKRVSWTAHKSEKRTGQTLPPDLARCRWIPSRPWAELLFVVRHRRRLLVLPKDESILEDFTIILWCATLGVRIRAAVCVARAVTGSAIAPADRRDGHLCLVLTVKEGRPGHRAILLRRQHGILGKDIHLQEGVIGKRDNKEVWLTGIEVNRCHGVTVE